MSERGVEGLMCYLAERARLHNRLVLVADHRAVDYPFDGIIGIVKGTDGVAEIKGG